MHTFCHNYHTCCHILILFRGLLQGARNTHQTVATHITAFTRNTNNKHTENTISNTTNDNTYNHIPVVHDRCATYNHIPTPSVP